MWNYFHKVYEQHAKERKRLLLIFLISVGRRLFLCAFLGI